MVKDLKPSKKQSVKSGDEGTNPTKDKSSKVVKKSDKSKVIKKEAKTKDAPTSSEPRKKLARRFNKLRLKAGEIAAKGIVYVGHLPKGFEEDELKKFFA